MKKTIYIFTLFTISLITIHLFSYSQGCLPEGITFSNQQQIDDFQTNYPGCTEIEGNVLIFGSDISNLNGLLGITTIGGRLEINEPINLNDLHGLDSLYSIGGNFWIYDNQSLQNLSGLNSLAFVGGNFTVSNMDDLINLTGLESLTSIGEHMYLEDNGSLSSLMGLSSLNDIGFGLTLLQNPNLTDLSGLENMNHLNALYIVYNNTLTNLNGLEVLETIGSHLYLQHNSLLSDIIALVDTDLSNLQELQINNNDVLAECDILSICEYLAGLTGTIVIEDNAPNCNNQEEVEEACLMGINESLKADNNYRIFPNPAKNSVAIESLYRVQTISIFDQSGIIVLQENYTDIVCDISTLKAGLYFIEIKTNKGINREKLIIK